MISLLNAGLLPWVAAIAIPVAIHLLTRKTRREMDLPTLRFLSAIPGFIGVALLLYGLAKAFSNRKNPSSNRPPQS